MPVQLAIIALLLFPHSGPWGPRDTRSQIEGWTLRVHTDRFAEHTTCRLSKRYIYYDRGALVFQLSSRANTIAAIYRIDGGPPRAASDDAMEFARLGFAIYNDDLTNPSAGLVRIPEGRLRAARAIVIEVKRSLFKFDVSSFAAALQGARHAGCGPGAFEG